ncbi:TIGR02677 family protein [Streptomyces sp. NBC_01433]|uniref:TIGR02677 family protein n=1 Tax=Streptomyces sp. NBC_01433 TaxID=2903864 RepID=UPI00225A56E7|nr:TIGR02677 family protein [Streptomyces sp. NBC_01433]MCX4680149.1 TIGR02677 family protein [Streptomyces sp. NBC_01433]
MASTDITPTSGIRVPADMFRFTTGNLAPLYSAILQAFGDANERLVTALGLDEVRERLRGVGWFDALTDEDLTGALKQLRAWELLDVIQNHAENYRTAEEYERRNLQYSLTRRGEAAFAGVQHALAVLASTGALQTAVLDAIADRLAELDRLMREAGSGDRRIFATLQELEGHLDALRGNTKQFNGELQRLLRTDGAELSTFHEVKGATVAYLQEFLTNLDQRAHAVAAAVARIEERGPREVWRRALKGAELPPLGGADPGPEWLARRQARWDGLRAWFLPVDGSAARVEQLHHVARRAIVTLLQVLDRITESRRRSTGAVQDFRELARWFAAAPGEDDMHRLWATAFGLGPSRHAHLAHADPELVPVTESWRDAPPVEVSALLRTSGRTEQFSRTGRVRDVAALKAARAERARMERAELEAAWSLLRTEAPIRLSHVGALDHEVFERLLDLLGRALATRPDASGTRRAVTGDGRVEVVLRPAADGLAPAVLRTSRGALTCPDYLLEVRMAGAR